MRWSPLLAGFVLVLAVGCSDPTQPEMEIPEPALSTGAADDVDILVTSTDDPSDPDGVTLREAIEEAGDGDVIGFHPDILPGTITLDQDEGSVRIEENLHILGPGPEDLAVSGGGHSRVFSILPRPGRKTEPLDVSISGITARDGTAGGILIDNALATLREVAVVDNESGGAGGGGILNRGTLVLDESTVSGNWADGSGGGIRTITRGPASTGPVESRGALILNSTIADNSSGGDGGGIHSSSGPTGLDLGIVNSTFSGNSATGVGGGVFVDAYAPGGPISVDLAHATISDNEASTGSGIRVTEPASSPGGELPQPVSVRNTIIASGDDGQGGEAVCDTEAELEALGTNLATDASCGDGFTVVSEDELALGPLGDNGGATLTHAPGPGSAGVDAVPEGECTDLDGNVLERDQRGVVRPQGEGCDVGSVESEISFLLVDIEVRPGDGDDTAPINPRSRGGIPVAILSDESLDAPEDVNRETLTFGATGEEDSLRRRGPHGEPQCGEEDVNGNDLEDLVCHFETQEAGFEPGDQEGILQGSTYEDLGLEGRAEVRIVGGGP